MDCSIPPLSDQPVALVGRNLELFDCLPDRRLLVGRIWIAHGRVKGGHQPSRYIRNLIRSPLCEHISGPHSSVAKGSLDRWGRFNLRKVDGRETAVAVAICSLADRRA
jgi:hypothetical protein